MKGNQSPLGGARVHRLISAATTNATSVKTAQGNLFSVHVHNINAAARFIKFYDKASAPTVGTDTPVATFYIGPTTAIRDIVFPEGMSFALGIAYALTALIADSDTTAVGANETVVNLTYL
jgi:hypothetical protein